jgi:hypothetical protein
VKQVVGDGFLENCDTAFGHGGGEVGIPRRGFPNTGERHGVGSGSGGGEIVGRVQAPWTGLVAAHDLGGDGDSGPVEVAVVVQRRAVCQRAAGQAMERGGRAAFGTYEGWAVGSEFLRGASQDGGVLAHVDLGGRRADRVRRELVERDLERRAVAGGAGQPFTQTGAVGGQVEYQDPAGQVVDDDVELIPQDSDLLRSLRPRRVGAQCEGAQRAGGPGAAPASI